MVGMEEFLVNHLSLVVQRRGLKNFFILGGASNVDTLFFSLTILFFFLESA